jgi:hypothetical protein
VVDGDIDLAFRLTNSDSKCQYFEPHNDIRCSGWRDFDLHRPVMKEEAQAHVDGKSDRPGPLISLDRSPRRLWNISKRYSYRRTDYIVAIMDMRLMEKLGIRHADAHA